MASGLLWRKFWSVEKKITLGIVDVPAKGLQSENESIYMENTGNSTIKFILTDFRANNSLLK